jgi:hypothetical protein
MEFMIAIRNAITGEEKNFPSLQHIADFLCGRDDSQDWGGHENMGPLPEPTAAVADIPADPAPESKPESDVEIGAIKADTSQMYGSMEVESPGPQATDLSGAADPLEL